MSWHLRRVRALTIAAILWAATGAAAATADFSGYLHNEGTKATFDIYAETETLALTFTYPAGSDFRVRVLGKDGNELGDFALTEGPVITLSGGGKFTLVVYSRRGGGAWTAYYER